MARPLKIPRKRLLRAVMAICMTACFLVSGHPIVVSVGQEAPCCGEGVCECTRPDSGAISPQSCCSASELNDVAGCCSEADPKPQPEASEHSGPTCQSRCLCGGEGPVVVVLGSPVRFDAAREAAGLEPKAAIYPPQDLGLEPESRKPEPTCPVPWLERC